MRIAIVSPVFPPYSGGIGNVAAFNAQELIKLGNQVEVFTPKYQEVDQEIFSEFKINRIDPFIKYGNAAFLPKLPKLLKGFDIIHLHYPFFGGAEIIWWCRNKFKKNKVKIIVHYHMDVVGAKVLKLFFIIHKKIVLPQIINLADKVIVTSIDYVKNSDIAKFYQASPQKFVAIPNGVAIDKFIPQEKSLEILNRHGIGRKEKVILFVGGLDKAHYFKGVEYLIEASSLLKNSSYAWKLIIVGQGELQRKYKSLAYQLGLENKIIFAGFVSDKELEKYYNISDVVVLPSIDKSEAFGLVLIEAMACGKAVVATNLSGVRSVVTDGVNGFLAEIKNPQNLAEKINEILNNESLAKNFGDYGRKMTEEKYSWKIIGQQLDNLYKSL